MSTTAAVSHLPSQTQGDYECKKVHSRNEREIKRTISRRFLRLYMTQKLWPLQEPCDGSSSNVGRSRQRKKVPQQQIKLGNISFVGRRRRLFENERLGFVDGVLSKSAARLICEVVPIGTVRQSSLPLRAVLILHWYERVPLIPLNTDRLEAAGAQVTEKIVT